MNKKKIMLAPKAEARNENKIAKIIGRKKAKVTENGKRRLLQVIDIDQ